MSATGFPPLTSGQHAVFVLPLDSFCERDFARSVGLLSGAERERLGRYAFQRDARQYGAARALLRLALGNYLGCQPEAVLLFQDAAGKPHVRSEQRLDFSITHCDGCVAVAIARDARVGIDIETLAREHIDYLELAQEIYSTPEYQGIRQQKPAQGRIQFVELWTLKEAYVKAIGLGLSKSLAECVFSFHADAGLRFRDQAEDDGHALQWRFQLHDILSSYRLSIATDGTADSPQLLMVDFMRGIGQCDVRLLRSSGCASAEQA